jgi:large subunit ribosomal protein L21
MFAIVRTGGKQYRVAAGDKIAVEKIAGSAGDSISLGDVLLAGEGSELKAAKDLSVSAEIIAQGKSEKVVVFKKRRRHNYRRKNGHRQQMTILKITAIGDEKPKAAAKKAEEPKVEAQADTTPAAVETQAAAPKAAAEKKPAAAKKPAAKKTDA